MEWIGYIGIGILVLLVLLVLVTNIQIVQQSRAYVVERLGAYSATWGVGLHFKIPFFERVVKKVSLKEQAQLTPIYSELTPKMRLEFCDCRQVPIAYDNFI